MGNGRHSGVQKSAHTETQRASKGTMTTTPGSKEWQEWQSKSIRDAMMDYDSNWKQEPGLGKMEMYNRGLNCTGLQRTVLKLNLAGPGRIAPDAEFDKAVQTAALDGREIYRGSSERAIDNLVNGDIGYIGDGVHGDGIYFSTSLDTAQAYGNKQVTAFIDKGLAKVIAEKDLRNMRDNESPEVANAFDGESGLSSYALYKGYNVIHVPGGNYGASQSVANNKAHGEDYYVPLTRKVLVFRKHSK